MADQISVAELQEIADVAARADEAAKALRAGVVE
jgi:hypothetical protein